MTKPLCRFCGRRCGEASSISAARRCELRSSRRTSCRRWSRSIRCTPTSARTACWCSSSEFESRRSTSSATMPISRRSPSSWLRHAEAYAARMARSLRLGPTHLSSRSPATTATCCSTSSERGIGVLGVEPAANVAAVANDEGHADRGRVLRHRDGATACSRRATGRPDRRQQRAGACAGPQRLRRRLARSC